MQVTTTKLGPVVYLTPSGALVESNLHDLEKGLAQADAEGPLNLVLDMRDSLVMDSKGLEFLLDLSARLKDSGGSLRLSNVNATCKTILRITRLDGLIALSDESEEGPGGPSK
jgi:anti-anti-sigma factor